jgi:hypothetical protein
MSTIAEVGPGSFDSYEGIRIVIPGLITFAAAAATFKTIAPHQSTAFLESTFLSLVGALAIGLILYFWDIPSRAASYFEDQPTDFLESQYPHVNKAELLTAYLLALNTKMPANIRNRALYMGSMYRIGIEMILALSSASAIVIGTSLLNHGTSQVSVGRTSRDMAGLFLLAIFAVAVLINRGYERKSAARSGSNRATLMRVLRTDLLRPSMWIYTVGFILLLLPNLTVLINSLPMNVTRAFALFGFAVCNIYWIRRYVRGDAVDPRNPRKRRKLNSVSSGALFLLPLVTSLFVYNRGPRTILPTSGYIAGWTAIASLVVLLVVIRGHERKLHGVYRGQTRWLKENPQAMEAVLPKPHGKIEGT